MSTAVKPLTMSGALNAVLRDEMRRDPRVIVVGEDVGRFGGAFLVTRGLLEEFGEDRVRDTPISEAAIIGAAIGAALMGWRPVAEMQYGDFVASGFDQIVNQAAKLHLMSGGQARVPMVLRLPIGAVEHGPQHDQSPEAWFMHVPGLKVAIPSGPADAAGLLRTAIRDDNPVVFCEHKALYGTRSAGAGRQGAGGPEAGEVSSEAIPFGVAEVKRPGADVTVVATALMVGRALAAAAALEPEGISVEVVDPRTLVPLDRDTLAASARRTGRALVVMEEVRTAGAGAEIAATISELAAGALRAPVARLGAADCPLPFAHDVQQALIPSQAAIEAGCRALARGGGVA